MLLLFFKLYAYILVYTFHNKNFYKLLSEFLTLWGFESIYLIFIQNHLLSGSRKVFSSKNIYFQIVAFEMSNIFTISDETEMPNWDFIEGILHLMRYVT